MFPSRPFPFFRRIIKEALWVGGISVCGLALGGVFVYFWSTPDAEELVRQPLAQTSVLYDRTGTHALYAVHGEENRTILPHDAIPDTMRVATIAAEDASFYSHPGVDWQAVIRAFIANTESGTLREGGSTITQQLVRNVLLDRRKTFRRKIREAALAVKIERHYSKDEILDLYLNTVPYGSNAYGIQAAARTYFDKDARDLTLAESAFLAALPKAPSYYSPYGNHRSEAATRGRWILERIAYLGLASRQDVSIARNENVLEKIRPFRNDIVAPHFVFSVLEELERRYGRGTIEEGGWRIRTTLDLDLQGLAETAVREGVRDNLPRGAENAALVAADPQTGDVLALVGSRDFFDTDIDGQVDVADSPRQPGSSFKPFAYARAFEKGFQPETILYDVPIDFGPDGSGNDYMPRNYDGRFHGRLTMRQTLAGSLNVPAVQTLYLAGVDGTIDLAHRMGITTLDDPGRYGLALVLGGGEVKLADMVAAFSVFATEGVRHPAGRVLEIEDADGTVVWMPPKISERVLDTQVARKVSSILSDDVARSFIFGPGSPLVIPGRTVAAKTGTTQEFRDAWTVGYVPSLAAGVWAGNNDNRPMKPGSDGVYVAAPIWHDFMRKALELKKIPDAPFPPYDPVVSDKPLLTGRPDGEDGSGGDGSIRYFRRSTGKEVPAEKFFTLGEEKIEARYAGDTHTVLWYVDKDDPLGPTPPDRDDPMLGRWEAAIKNTSSTDMSGM